MPSLFLAGLQKCILRIDCSAVGCKRWFLVDTQCHGGFFMAFPVYLGLGGRCHGFPARAAREAEPIAGGGGGGGGGDPASAAISLRGTEG